MSEIEFMGSIDYPPEKWVDLGSVKPVNGKHEHIVFLEMDKK
jgi:hypothetical protein